MVIHLVVGLPGSGKTHHAKECVASLCRGGLSAILIDDPKSKEELQGLGKHHVVYITDPHLCKYEARVQAVKYLKELYPEAVIRYKFFENDPVQCRKNVLYRNDGRKVDQMIEMLSKVYTLPTKGQLCRVWGQTQVS